MSTEWESAVYLLFDRPPDQVGLVETRSSSGEVISLGEWRERDDGRWELVIRRWEFPEPPNTHFETDHRY